MRWLMIIFLKKISNEDRLKYTGANRLMLHANSISFVYKDRKYDIESKASLKEHR